jgi:hypothetical protein
MRAIASVLLALMIPSAFAECAAKSSSRSTPLVELYTSEGCSSCPPADRWFSTLRAQADAGAVVPIAFHVDYWNNLGWKDAYSDARFTQRQRDFAHAVGARFVYTPQLVLAGRDFPDWRGGAGTKAIEASRAQASRAELEVTGSATSPRVVATLAPGLRTSDLALVVAVTQDGIETKVKAGENRGETLRHDFVARDVRVERSWSSAAKPSIDTRVEFMPRPDWKTDQMRVVAFVQDIRTGQVLQSLAASCR